MHRRREGAGALVALVFGTLLLAAACTGAPEAADPGTTDRFGTVPAPGATSETAPDTADGYRSVIEDDVVDNPAFDPLEARIEEVVAAAGLPGASLLVVHDGVLVEQEAWGEYDVSTKVPIASGTKWLAAATIMTVVEEGLLALDEPISTYVPELADQPTGAITLRQLLSFTSGLRPDTSDPCSEDAETDLATCARRLVANGIRHAPGTEFHYDSVHLIVAAALAEQVTGVPFAELFQQRIAEPLGMSSTRLLQVRDPTRQQVDHPNPAGSAVSTLGDYGRFLEMIVHDGVAPDGTRVLSAASIAEMERNQTEGLPVFGSAFRRHTQAPYGLGHWIDWTSPNGDTLVSSSPGTFGFRPWVDRSNDVFGVYLVVDTIEPGDPGYGDPDRPNAGGEWILEMTAEAVGGSLPTVAYPHRS